MPRVPIPKSLFPRVRTDFRNAALPLLGGILIALASVQKSRAGLLVYEPFAYPSGTGIANQAAGLGFTGPWVESGDDPLEADLIKNGSLSYGTLQNSGNFLSSESVSYGGSTLTRNFSIIPGTSDTTTWIAFELSATASRTLEGEDSAYLAVAPNSADTAVRLGAFFNGTKMVLGIGSNQDDEEHLAALSNTSFLTGQTYFLVARIQWSGNEDPEQISLYINPSLDGSESTPSVSRNDLNIATSGSGADRLSQLQFASVGDDISWSVDEIRLGSSISDVVPVPEPSVATLGLLTGIFLFFSSRKQLRR